MAKSVKSYMKTVWSNYVSPYIRLRDCLKTTGTIDLGKCFTCGKYIQNGTVNCQAGHWKGRNNHATIFDEDNLRIQCDVCNDWHRGNGMRPAFEKNLREEIGDERVDRIDFLSRTAKQFTIDELKEVRDEYKRKYDKAMKEIV